MLMEAYLFSSHRRLWREVIHTAKGKPCRKEVKKRKKRREITPKIDRVNTHTFTFRDIFESFCFG